VSDDTRGYILTFRCLNCGRHEAFANVLSNIVLSDEQVKTQILEATCKGCGWTGEVCGVSAVRIEHAKSKSTGSV
jgi:Pyruvate/2-oxoacid:ferredoxin oxidoreductase delta subunit